VFGSAYRDVTEKRGGPSCGISEKVKRVGLVVSKHKVYSDEKPNKKTHQKAIVMDDGKTSKM